MHTETMPYVFYGYIYKHIKAKKGGGSGSIYYKFLTLITLRGGGRGLGLEEVVVRWDFSFIESFKRRTLRRSSYFFNF